MGTTKILIFVCIVLILILYIQSYLKPKTEYTILQYNLDKITPDSLYNKTPIIIYDILKDPKDLLTTLFEYSYIYKTYTRWSADKIYQCRSKFTIVYSNDESGCLLNIVLPKYKIDKHKSILKQSQNVQYITVKLKQNQVIILPMFWYMNSNRNVNMILLDDFISIFRVCFY